MGKRIRRLRVRLEKAIRRYKRHRGVRIDLCAPGLDDVVRTRILEGKYEQAEFGILSQILEPQSRVLELGTCIGFLAAYAAQVVGDDRVTTVEANPEVATLAARTFELNGVRPATILGAAATTDGDQVDFFLGESVWSSSTDPRQSGRRISVETVDVNRLLHELRPTVLIVDIEGAEIDLLPALDLACVRHLVVEFHPERTGDASVSSCVAGLLAQGFAVSLERSSQSVLSLSRASAAQLAA